MLHLKPEKTLKQRFYPTKLTVGQIKCQLRIISMIKFKFILEYVQKNVTNIKKIQHKCKVVFE